MSVHRRFLLLFSVFWLFVLVCSVVLVRKNSVAPAQPEIATAAPEPLDRVERLKALADEEKQTQAHVEVLAGLEDRRKLRDEAARNTYEARRQLQLSRADAWSSVLVTNRQAFEVLRHLAEGSPDGNAHCTICDGTGAMDYCVLCENASKCPSCKGTGKGLRDEICATCMGSGKCYLCSGTGRMACLYCDDGTVSRKGPLPPLNMPVRCEPVPAQEFLVAHSTDAELESAEAIEAQTRDAEPQPQAATLPPSGYAFNGLLLAVVLLLAGAVLAIRKAVAVRNALASQAAARLRPLLAEDPSLVGLFTALRDGLTAAPLHPVSEELDSLNGVGPQMSEDNAVDRVGEFFATAPSQVVGLRTLFSEITRAADEAARQKILLEFHGQVSDLKDLAQLPEVRPFGLLAYALAGLLKQLASNASEVTPSVLRTVAGAVDLLEDLCVPGLNPNLATEPPVRLLAVDDDAVSRLAISLALKKAFNAPDLASDGQAALDLIARQSYDVIFLDVDMPGMDGFELCIKIRQTTDQRTTPVVFVTRHSDFNSRAKSTLSGGQDLIGKPFLAFEITVKALTLALRGRLQNGALESRIASAFEEPALSLPARASAALGPCAQAASLAAASGEEGRTRTKAQKCRESEINPTAPSQPDGRRFPALAKASREDSPDAFFIHASVYLEQLRNHLQTTLRAADPVQLQKLLGELILGVQALNLEAEQAEVRSVSRLSAALEGMVKKLWEHPKLCTPSTMDAAAAALDLLDDLCWTKSNPDLAGSPVRLLVVDDDPVARRAVCGALQLAFGRPDSADSGEAALAVAAEKTFDLIFLDVLMPGVDGYATCRRIRETGLNPGTPIVFVASHDDTEARSRAADAGGCGFIPKPVLASQITLIALTFVLRARLDQPAPATVLEEMACLELA